MALHLYQGCRVQPGSVRLVSPQPGTQVQDSPHDRQVAVHRAWTPASPEPVPNERLQGAVVNLLDGQLANVRIQHRQRPCIPLETSLVLVLLQEPGGRFSEAVRLASAEEARGPDLLEPSRENCYGLPEIACASALANARSVEVFVDVPDRTSQGEAGRFTLSHDFLLSGKAAGRPLRRT